MSMIEPRGPTLLLALLLLVLAGCSAPATGQSDQGRPEVSHTNPKMDGPPGY
jgi:uncharacterized lipoprotein